MVIGIGALVIFGVLVGFLVLRDRRTPKFDQPHDAHTHGVAEPSTADWIAHQRRPPGGIGSSGIGPSAGGN